MKKSILLFSALAVPFSGAVTVNVPITSVTHIRQGSSSNNYGADASMIVGRTSTDVIRGLLSTSLSSIPAGSIINSITLNLRVSGIGETPNEPGAVALEVYQLTGTFTEGTGGSNGVTPGGNLVEATWNNRSNGTPWATPGGDFTTLLTSEEKDDPSDVEGNQGAGNQNMVFDSTSAFVAAAQAALDGGTPLSILMKLDTPTEASTLRRPFFYDSDNDNVSQGNILPFFSVDYTIPEPSVTLLASAFASLGLLRRRR